jgi:type II secretory pathway predicted ATPase ExeA
MARVRRLPFVARAGALADISAAFDAARSARGGLLLVTGESGMGKSRLAEEAARHADGSHVVWTWCTPGGTLRPWSRVVRALAGTDAAAARIVQQSTYLAELVAGRPDAPHGDPETVRWRLSHDLTGLLGTSSRPLLVVIDDLHDADPSSLQLLVELAPALRSMAAVVLATARDGDPDWLGQRQVWAMLNRLGETVRLRPFQEADIAALLSQTLRGPPPAEAVRIIAARTRGHPLLVCELVRGEPELGDLTQAVPASIRALVGARLDGLAELARRVLPIAAVLGTGFRLDVLAEVAETSLGELGTAMSAARTAGLLDDADAGEGRFRHQLIRDTIYETLPTDQRANLHQRAATVLATFAHRGRDIEPAEVADHLLRGGPAVAREAAEFAGQAGEAALRRYAYEDAVRWYAHADTRLASAGAGEAERARVKLALGEARHAAGDRAGARSDLLEAAERARRAARPDLLARAALALGTGPVGFEVGLLDREQIVLLEEARTALGVDHGTLTALVTARLSIALTLLESPQRRCHLAENALQAARRAGDDSAVAASLAALCDAMAGPDHCGQRRQYASEIVMLAHQLRDPALELLGRRLRMVAMLETGAIAEADAEMLAYRTVAQALRHPLYLWYVPLWRGMRALLEGRYDGCRAALEETAALGAQAASDNAAMLAATQRWCLLAELGDAESLTTMLAQFEAMELAGVWPQIVRGLLLAQLGRIDDARAQLDVTAPQLPATPRDSEWLPMLAQLALLIHIIGAHPVAAWAYEVLSPYAELFVVEGIGAAVRGPVNHSLGLLAVSMGNRTAAATHFAAAVQAASAVGAPRLVARIRADSGVSVGADGNNVFRRDGDYWTIRHRSVEFRLRDSKGLRDLRELLARPGTSIAALDLASTLGERRGARQAGLHRPSDAGEVLDATARAAYRRRLHELEREADEADAMGDAERSARLAAERDALLAALTTAYGLGGRGRRMGSAAERARTAVTTRIRDAIRRIAQADPELGEHLSRSVRTGTFCVYDPAAPLHWSVSDPT